jgi:CDP-diacylglycerol--glycerol-3-phosphate 3-phosphatidyltransferase
MTLPNLLTGSRFVSGPLIFFLFVGTGATGWLAPWLSPTAGLWACLVLAMLSELTDLLDGWVARRLNQVTDLGKVLDPFADSVYRLSVFFAFASGAHGAWAPPWAPLLLFYRDMAVTLVRAVGLERGLFIQARLSGKLKAIVQGAAAVALLGIACLMGPEAAAWERWGLPLVLPALTMTVWSAFDYVWANRGLFAEASS